jgi:tetratricopeptide (TPR) repeat protein
VLPLEVAGGERWAADGYCILGQIQTLTGEWDAAAANFQHAIQMRQGAGHRAGATEATVGLGTVYLLTGSWAEAAATFDSAVQISSAMDTSPSQVMAQRHRGLLRLVTGDLDGAAIAIEDAYALAGQMPESLEYAPSVLAMARLRALHGDRGEALHLALEALANARQVQQLIEVHTLLGTLYHENDEPDRALEHANEAVATAELLGSPWLISRALVSQARVSAATDVLRANEIFERAIRCAEQARTPCERAQARDAYAAHLQATDQG